MTRWLLFALTALTALVLANPLSAALPALDGGGEAAAPAQAPAPAIEDRADAAGDERIRTRIRGILDELDGYGGVDVAVREGVVTLTGTVADEEAVDEAGTLAGRVQGVVTVRNELARDTSVESSVAALGGLQDRVESWIAMLPLVAVAVAVGLGIALVGWLLGGLGALWHRIAPNSFLADLIGSAIRFASAVLGLVVALDMIGAGALMGAVLGGAGVIGLALGFAMRDTVENYVASLMLSLRQPFRANDHVVIDDKEGRVIRLTSRATVLMTLDGNHLRIPNSAVFKAVILNYTRNPQRRFDFELGIDADDNPNNARRLGRETLAGLPFVLDNPPPEARTEAVGDSNIVLRFFGWIDQSEADWHRARSRAIAAVKTALEDAGFGLPEPIYRLRFDARTDPLPFENIDGPKATAEREKKARTKSVSIRVAEAEEDVSPGNEIAEMVARERRTEPDAEGGDLLDSGRPVE